MHITFRETLFRTSAAMARLKGRLVVVCGAGALGANLAESLARCGVDRLRLVDRDRIEEHNLSTQPYTTDDVGAFKAEVLSYNLYRAVGVEAEVQAKELTSSNVVKMIKDAALVVDCFDNSQSRRLVHEAARALDLPCLHAGMADACAEVLWNEQYRVPSDRGDDVCDYPLARNLVTLTTAVLSETVLRYLMTDERAGWTVTLGDLRVQPFAE